MRRLLAFAILLLVSIVVLPASAGAQGRGRGHGAGRGREEAPVREFNENDRGVLRQCLSGNTAGLPPGLAKRDRLPPGLERQVRRNGTLPPGLQKRVQPLPGTCDGRLPQLPVDWRRVIL